MEFWMSMGRPDDCPLIFPDNVDKESVQSYFTQKTSEFNVLKNKRWLKEEIASIISAEREL